MRLIFTIGVFVLLSCNTRVTEKLSYWENQRHGFKYANKFEFFSDSALLDDLKHLKKLPLQLEPWIDSVYLYSWQECNSSKVEFTVVGIEGKYGPSIFYVIFNKKDSLLTSKRIAGSNDEGDTWQNFGSIFISKDTFQEIDHLEFFTLDRIKKYKLNQRLPIHVITADGEFSVRIREFFDSSSVVR
jgi:hypothetical protein